MSQLEGQNGKRMKINNLEYDNKAGNIIVEIEIPVVGDLSAKEAKTILTALLETICPEIIGK